MLSSAPLVLPLPSMGLRISWSSEGVARSRGTLVCPGVAEGASSYIDSSTWTRVEAAEDEERFLGRGRLRRGAEEEEEAEEGGGGPAEVEGREEEEAVDCVG